MAIPQQDGTVLAFSVDITEGSGPMQTYGIVQNYTENHVTERAEAKGTSGDTVSIQEYDDKYELSLNYLELGSPSGDPAIGSAFTFNAKSYLVSSVSSTDTVDGFRSVDITATSYPHLP